MLSHGVDVSRLNVMVMLGLPLGYRRVHPDQRPRRAHASPGSSTSCTRSRANATPRPSVSSSQYVTHGDRFVEPIPITRRSRRVLRLTMPGIVEARRLAVMEPASATGGSRRFGCCASTSATAAMTPAARPTHRRAARLRPATTTGCSATRSGDWLDSWFANLEDPATTARWPSELGRDRADDLAARRRGQRPHPRLRTEAPTMSELGHAAAARSFARSCPSRPPTSRRHLPRHGVVRRRPAPGRRPSVVRRRLLREIRPLEVAGTDGGVGSRPPRQRPPRGRRARRRPRASPSSGSHRCGSASLQAHRQARRHEAAGAAQKPGASCTSSASTHCGAVVEPWIRRCPAHDDVRLVEPQVRQGHRHPVRLPHLQGRDDARPRVQPHVPGLQQGNITWNVHKARSSTPRAATVLVNPPRPEQLRSSSPAAAHDEHSTGSSRG